MKSSKIKKIAISLFLIVSFSAYVFYKRFSAENVIFINNYEKRVGTNNPIVSPSLPSSMPATHTTGQYRDGQYIGRVADAYYGNVQVKAYIKNSKISDVQFLQYPNDRRTSIEINNQAIPYLKQEAIQAQSDKVDIVSGATQTSGAFQESLASALSQARN